jgi:hypothetical protein
MLAWREGKLQFQSTQNLGAGIEWVDGGHHAPAALTQERSGTHGTKGSLDLGSGLVGMKNLAPTRIRSPDHS